MFDVLMPVSILGSFGTALYFFTKVLTDYLLRKKMIEKGFVSEETQSIFKQYKEENKDSSLKWGLLILFAGIALVIIDVTNVNPASALPYGIFAISVSIGFLLYYFMVRRTIK